MPISIRLRPCNTSKQNHECFRLFFLDQELVAICPYSPWAFHGEIVRSKDVVITTLAVYSQKNLDLRKLMRELTKKANEPLSPMVPVRGAAVSGAGAGFAGSPEDLPSYICGVYPKYTVPPCARPLLLL